MACHNCIVYIVSLYALLMVFFLCLLWCFKIDISRRGPGYTEDEDGSANWFSWLSNELFDLIENIWLNVIQNLVTMFYGLYTRLTWCSVLVIILKYIVSGLYAIKMLKDMYKRSRERIFEKQMELDDIQLQFQIAEAKVLVVKSKFSERSGQLARCAARLRDVRARVRSLLATDDALRRIRQRADDAALPRDDGDQEDPLYQFSAEEERKITMALLKELTIGEQDAGLEKMEHLERGDEPPGKDQDDADASVYSSLSDADSKQECHVKIIKVTNVYKVACLKHYIKQKRMRRATQQAILKKKIEGIQKLLESWQKSLNAVIYNKISPVSIDMTSQEAMGDYSKQNLREFSDSDSELKTSCTDICYDEYNNVNWRHNNYYNGDVAEAPQPKQVYNSVEYSSYQQGFGHMLPRCECNAGGALFMLPEETTSQVAIEEIDDECRDMVPI